MDHAVKKEIIVYSRTYGCPYVRVAKRVFERYQVEYREIMVNHVLQAKQRVRDWTGYESVPTIVIAEPGKDLPYELPAPLPKGASPRGVNRGSMITEPSEEQLTDWLRQHGLID